LTAADRSTDPVAVYEDNAAALADLYESVPAEVVHSVLADLIPRGPGVALDIGAGSGRDAAWLASFDYDVVATEPAAANYDVASSTVLRRNSPECATIRDFGRGRVVSRSCT